MSDRIGVLDEKSVATVGVTTVYTCPSGKAAKVKCMYRGAAGSSSTLKVTVNGIDIFLTGALTSGNISYSSTSLMHQAGAASTIDGSADGKVVAPGPKEFYLSAGDTISYEIGTAAFSSMNFQVVGSEIDV